jgi:segregation and condensation protein A
MAYEIDLECFKGPLDLLLHLIKKNEMDICNIPIAEITRQYLAAIDTMTSLNLDVAGDFLVMAATLLHIKSRLLLPRSDAEEPEEEEIDPRAELVLRLLEYQKYKDAALSLDKLPLLGRDVFVREAAEPEPEAVEEDKDNLAPVGLYELVEAFRHLLAGKGEPSFHRVEMERFSVADRIQLILSALAKNPRLSFLDLFADSIGRSEVVVTFLAMLELVKLRSLRLMQNSRCGTIWLYAVGAERADGLPLEEESLGYN